MTRSKLISQKLVREAVALGGARLSLAVRLKFGVRLSLDGKRRGVRLRHSLDEIGKWFFDNAFKHPSGCWIWMGPMNSRSGHGQIKVNGQKYNAQRVALCLNTGKSLNYPLQACHKIECLAPICVNPEHLYWGSHSDNGLDAVKTRRIAGLPWAGQKLSTGQAIEIRNSKLPRRELANKYGVTTNYITKVQLNHTIIDPALPHNRPLLHLQRLTENI